VITQGAADEDQRGKGEQVAVDDPLKAGNVGIEVAPDLRQRDVHHRRLEEGDPGSENRDREHPTPSRRPETELGCLGRAKVSALPPLGVAGHRATLNVRSAEAQHCSGSAARPSSMGG
jgi:hypothetical protein